MGLVLNPFTGQFDITGGGVTSVNGQTGDVQLDAEDIPYDNSTSGLAATDVQAAIDELDQAIEDGDAAKANRNLDNLEAPTEIGVDLLPVATDTYSVGEAGNQWLNVQTSQVTADADLLVTATDNLLLRADAGNAEINAAGSLTITATDIDAGATIISNVVDPVDPQDAATKNYVDTEIGNIDAANTTLSNLVAPTAINEDLLPDAQVATNIGSDAAMFGIIRGQSFRASNESVAFTGDTTSASPTIVVANTAGLFVGQEIIGTGIGNAALISSIIPNTSITLDQNASATNAGVALTAVWPGLFRSADQTGATPSAQGSFRSGNTVNAVSGGATLRSGNSTGSGASGPVTVRSGDNNNAAAGITGTVTVRSGNITNAGASVNTGSVTVQSGSNSGTGASGNVFLRSQGANAGGSGSVNISSGTAFSGGNSGNLNLSTGLITGTGNSGLIFSNTGGTSSGNSGSQFHFTGNASSTGNSGGISLQTGTAVDGGSGGIGLATGDVTSGTQPSGDITLGTGLSAGGARGVVRLDGSEIHIMPEAPLRFFDAAFTGAVGFKVPSTLISGMDYILPATAPAANGQILSTDLGGTLSWVTPTIGSLANNVYLTGRNAANTADINIIKVDTGDQLWYGDSTSVTRMMGSDIFIVSAGDVQASGTTGMTLTSGGDLLLRPEGTVIIRENQAQTDGGELRINDADGSNYIGIKAPATVASNYTLTLPVDDGASGEVLSTNGSGVLSWVSAGGAGANTTLSNLTSPTAINQDLLPASAISNSLGSASLPWNDSFMINVLGGTGRGSAEFGTSNTVIRAAPGNAGVRLVPNGTGRIAAEGPMTVNTEIIPDVQATVELGSDSASFGEVRATMYTASNVQQVFSGDTTAGDNTVLVADTTGLYVGMFVTGSTPVASVIEGSSIVSIVTNTSITLDIPAVTTATDTITATFGFAGYTTEGTGSTISAPAYLATGNTEDRKSGDIAIVSGNSTGVTTGAEGGSGLIYIATGTVGGEPLSEGASGGLFLLTGDSSGEFNPTGNIEMRTGAGLDPDAAHNTGHINIRTGDAPANTSNLSGTIDIRTGSVGVAGISGGINMITGITAGDGATGPITINTGNLTSGTNFTGDIYLIPGEHPTTPDNRGVVHYQSVLAGFGGRRLKTRAVSADDDLTIIDHYVYTQNTTPITLTMPTMIPYFTGQEFYIFNAGSDTVTVAGSGGDTVLEDTLAPGERRHYVWAIGFWVNLN